MADKTPGALVIRLMDVQRARGLTGSEMSRRLRIHPSTWTRLVAADVQPSLRVVQEAVAAFPELRSFCVQLLMIRTGWDEDSQTAESVEAAV